MSFYTAINCMDGRVQLPLNAYLQARFGVSYIDTITEPGPALILAEGTRHELIASIHERIRISVEKHHSLGIAVAGHHDCAGDPCHVHENREHIRIAADKLRAAYPAVPVIGLWIDENWAVSEVYPKVSAAIA
ncbi:MAG: carbonic anhydrase [Verrucomicrobiota bacterium]